MSFHFEKLITPTKNIADTLTLWENDPLLVPLTRPNQNQTELQEKVVVTLETLEQRLVHHHIFLIYLDEQLVGEMNFMRDPEHLFKKETGTAWMGITIGEPAGRGKGVGYEAIRYLESQIKKEGLHRVELGVFEFNEPARKLYERLGYQEIGRLENFTYWKGKYWTDIRMEKII